MQRLSRKGVRLYDVHEVGSVLCLQPDSSGHDNDIVHALRKRRDQCNRRVPGSSPGGGANRFNHF